MTVNGVLIYRIVSLFILKKTLALVKKNSWLTKNRFDNKKTLFIQIVWGVKYYYVVMQYKMREEVDKLKKLGK